MRKLLSSELVNCHEGVGFLLKMVNTTFSTNLRESKTESADSKIASSVSEIMKIPKNMFLLAEARVSTERLHAVMQEAAQTLHILETAGTEGGIPPPRSSPFQTKVVQGIKCRRSFTN